MVEYEPVEELKCPPEERQNRWKAGTDRVFIPEEMGLETARCGP